MFIATYHQVLDPVSNSLFVSSLFALVPIVTLFVLIGGLRIAAHIAAPIALLLSILVAVIVYSMPVGQARRLRSRGRGVRVCSRSCGSSGRRSGSTT